MMSAVQLFLFPCALSLCFAYVRRGDNKQDKICNTVQVDLVVLVAVDKSLLVKVMDVIVAITHHLYSCCRFLELHLFVPVSFESCEEG